MRMKTEGYRKEKGKELDGGIGQWFWSCCVAETMLMGA